MSYACFKCNRLADVLLGRLSSVFLFWSAHSFFLGELEKCLEDPDRLASLFVKQVGNLSTEVFGEACIFKASYSIEAV